MTETRENSVSLVIVAAGQSSRFQAESQKSNLSKMEIEWNGRTLLEHTVQSMLALEFHEIALVVRSGRETHAENMVDRLMGPMSLKPKVRICRGGQTRQESVFQGLCVLGPCHRVFIHDGARPFLERDFLDRLWIESRKFDALIPVIPVVETLKEVAAGGLVVQTVDRSRFFRVQTPQVFKYSKIREVHEFFLSKQSDFTDDAAMFEAAGLPVMTCPGSSSNIKVTTTDDLKVAGISWEGGAP